MQRLTALGLALAALSLVACQGTPTGVSSSDRFLTKDTAIGGFTIPAGVDTSPYTQGAAQGYTAGLAGASQGLAGGSQGLGGADAGLGGAALGASAPNMGLIGNVSSLDLALMGASMGAGMGGQGMGNMAGLTTYGATLGPGLATGLGGMTGLGGVTPTTAGIGGIAGF